MKLFYKSKKMDGWKEEDWYTSLTNEGKYIYELIDKYHKYFSSQDRKYRKRIRTFKILVLFLAMSNTIVLGLKNIICIDIQVVVGLIVSSLLTFLTAILSYFNFEKYWMRNITIHIELNIIRDNYVFDAKSQALDLVKIKEYRKKLEEIQIKNISYWENAIT